MRRSLALAATLLLATLPLIDLSYGIPGAYISRVDRTIIINEFGVTIVTDNLTVKNNGTATLESLDWGFPARYSSRLEVVEATEPTGEVMIMEKMINESSMTQWLELRTNEPIPPGTTYQIKVRSIFSNLITPDGKDYLFTFTPYPTLKLPAEVCNTTILLPKGAVPKEWPNQSFTAAEIGGNPALVGIEESLEPFTSKEISFKYSSDAQELVFFRSIERQILITPSGQVRSKDTYKITNLGSELNSLTIPRPRNSSPILLYDSAGPTPERLQVQRDSITVQPRFGKLATNTSFTFRLEYGLPPENLRRLEWQGRYRFVTELAFTSGYVAESYSANISLPRGARLEHSSSQPNSTSTLPTGDQLLIFNLGRLPPLTTKKITIDYNYHIFSPSIYPLQWIFVLELIVTAFAAALFSKRPTKAVTAVPAEKVRKFIDLHDEKRILRLELEKIGDEASRGAITKHDYRRRSRTIEVRMGELNRQLAALTSELKTVDPRYDQIGRRLERAESEIDALRASETQLTNQYRTGRISRQVYESLRSDLRKRMDKAKETIDSIIVTLR
ncbi:MAG: hypothetical protein QW828_08430, partial [Candidatus Bathyarchaeia archaeon]